MQPGLEVAGGLGFTGGLEAPVRSVEEEEGFSFDAEFVWEDRVEVPSSQLALAKQIREEAWGWGTMRGRGRGSCS